MTGSLGSINSATSKKYITYDPDAVNSLSVTGEVTSTVNGAIKMTIPKSLVGNPAAGAKLTSVTGYAFSQRGPLLPMAAGQANPSSLPNQVDASGASTYVVGQNGPLFDGVVEVSIDDTGFTAPRLATLGPDINQNSWQLTLSGGDLVPGAHTLYVRQRINGRALSPVVSVAFTVASTVEQSVTSMVSLTTANARSMGGLSSYDLVIKNTAAETIFAPLRLEVVSISAADGSVTVANADNAETGAGALWDYSTKLGTDNGLTAGETSGTRNLRFSNPNNVAFTVTFKIIGNLARNSVSGSSASSSEGGGTPSAAPGGNTPATNIPGPLYSLTYNPILNIVVSKLNKP